MSIFHNGNYQSNARIAEHFGIISEVVKIHHKTRRHGNKELHSLPPHEISQISIERNGIAIIICEESCTAAQCEAISELPAECCGATCVVMCKWRVDNIKAKSVMSFGETVQSAASPGIGLCRSGEYLMAPPKILPVVKKLQFIKVQAAFCHYLRSALRSPQDNKVQKN